MDTLTKDEFLVLERKCSQVREQLSPKEKILFDDFIKTSSEEERLQKIILAVCNIEPDVDEHYEITTEVLLKAIRQTLSTYEHSSIRFRKCQDEIFDLLDQYGFDTIGTITSVLLDAYAEVIVNNIDKKDQEAYVNDQFQTLLEQIANRSSCSKAH